MYTRLYVSKANAMGYDIFPCAKHQVQQQHMEREMKNEVGWTNSRDFREDSWGLWYAIWANMTGVHTSDHLDGIETLSVHKALIHAMNWIAHKETPRPECKQFIRWLEICCDYNAGLSVSQ